MDQSPQLSPRLRLLCAALKWLTIACVLFSAWAFFAFDVIDQMLDAYWARLNTEQQAVVTVHNTKRYMLMMLATVGYFAPVLIPIAAFRVFHHFHKSDVLSTEAAKRVRFLGVTIIIYALTQIVSFTLSVVLLTYDNPTGEKVLSIAVNTSQLITLMIGIIIVVIGHIFTYANAIAEENRQFI